VQLFGVAHLYYILEADGIFNLMAGGRIPLESASTMGTYWLTWAQGPSLALVSIMFFN